MRAAGNPRPTKSRIVIDQPYFVRVSRRESAFIDLRLTSSADQKSICIVEVKCFAKKMGLLDEFYHAVGQYLTYRSIFKLRRIDDPLYLSVPKTIYDDFFQRKTVQLVLNDAKIKVLVVDIDNEDVIAWID